MDELLTGWARVIASPEFIDALNAGETAVIHMLGEVIDEWLQSISPVYKIAVEACQQTDVGGFDCDVERIKLRDKMLTDILKLTGLIVLIRQALKLWDAVPAETRKRLRLTVENADTIKDMMENPDGATLYRGVVATYKITRNYAEPIIKDVLAGNINSPLVNGYFRDISNLEPNSVFKVTRYYGLDIEQMGYDRLRALEKQTFGPVIGEALNLLFNPVGRATLALSLGVEGATDLGNGLIEVGGVVVDLGKEAANRVIKAGGEAADIILTGVDEVTGVIDDGYHYAKGKVEDIEHFFGL